MNIDDIDTPAVIIDLDKVAANLAAAQNYADQHGLALRPHVKTHKLARFAQDQIGLGAIGITAQKLGEAEDMANGGIHDIFLPYNILGAAKLNRLLALHNRVKLSVTADSSAVVDGYETFFKDPGNPLAVLVECDTGAGRCGVQTREQAVTLARQIDTAPGLTFAGLMTYPPQGKTMAVQEFLTSAIAALTAASLPPAIISSGGHTPLRNNIALRKQVLMNTLGPVTLLTGFEEDFDLCKQFRIPHVPIRLTLIPGWPESHRTNPGRPQGDDIMWKPHIALYGQ